VSQQYFASLLYNSYEAYENTNEFGWGQYTCYVGFVVEKLALELAFILVLQFPQYHHINPPLLYFIHLTNLLYKYYKASIPWVCHLNKYMENIYGYIDFTVPTN